MVGAAEGVEHLQLRAPDREAAVLVLAVEGEQPAPELAQVGRCGGAALHECTRAAFRAHAASQHDLVGLVVDSFPELGERVAVEHARRKLEDALHVRLARAGADDPGPRAPAQQEVERVGQHGLARPGLAGDRNQARPEPELGPLDQQEVLDSQLH